MWFVAPYNITACIKLQLEQDNYSVVTNGKGD
jgi:hypothetical protein